MDLNSPKNSTRITMLIGIAFVAIIMYQFFSMKNPNAYQTKIETFRQQKDAQFKNAEDSPIPATERANFQGLSYFPIQEQYRVYGKLTPVQSSDTIRLVASKGAPRKYFLIGKLSFELLQKPTSLNAYRAVGEKPNTLFVPFYDLTSGVSSYGGGRYLDLVYDNNNPSTDIEIDFNQAYNPYCVYNATYSCPLPPTENKIALEVMAGEKTGNKH